MNTVHFESAHYVPVEFPLATLIQRWLATLIDIAVILCYVFLSIIIALEMGIRWSMGGSDLEMLAYILLFRLPILCYFPFCEYFFDGQTIGKYIVGIRIMTIHGDRIGLKEVGVRWIFKGDFLWIGNHPLFFLVWFFIGLLALPFVAWSPYRQRLADRLANTVVIQVKKRHEYSLSTLLAIKNKSNHTIIYPQAVIFSDEDMLFIKQLIDRQKNNFSPIVQTLIQQVCTQMTSRMNVPPIKEKYTLFLQQVLYDYVVLTR